MNHEDRMSTNSTITLTLPTLIVYQREVDFYVEEHTTLKNHMTRGIGKPESENGWLFCALKTYLSVLTM